MVRRFLRYPFQMSWLVFHFPRLLLPLLVLFPPLMLTMSPPLSTRLASLRLDFLARVICL